MRMEGAIPGKFAPAVYADFLTIPIWKIDGRSQRAGKLWNSCCYPTEASFIWPFWARIWQDVLEDDDCGRDLQ